MALSRSGAASLVERDAVWREARLKGVVLKRERNQLIGFAQDSAPRMVGLYLDARFQIAAWSAAAPDRFLGHWYHPGPQARKVFLASSDRLLRTALKAHARHPTLARERGEKDKLAFWMDATAALCQAIPVGLTIATSQRDITWTSLLKSLRRWRLWQGPDGLLESLQWQEREPWKPAVTDATSQKQVPTIGQGQAAFACVALGKS